MTIKKNLLTFSSIFVLKKVQRLCLFLYLNFALLIMTSSKIFEKIAILKNWQLFFLEGVTTHFGEK